MKTKAIHSIEFVGGPIDGHVSHFVGPIKPFVGVKTQAVSADAKYLTAMLHLLLSRDKAHSRVLAIYELQTHNSLFSYHYIRSNSEKTTNFNANLVDTSVPSRNSSLIEFIEW